MIADASRALSPQSSSRISAFYHSALQISPGRNVPLEDHKSFRVTFPTSFYSCYSCTMAFILYSTRHLLSICQVSTRLLTNCLKSSNPALVVNGDSQPQSNPDVTLSSCTDRSYIPTPYNSPIRRNPGQACNGSAMSTMRLRGCGPPKRPAPSLRGSNTKKTRVGKGRAKKSKDDVYDDGDSVLTDGNSPLYSDANITVSSTPRSRVPSYLS
jgi:hypothetical protein